MPNSPSRLSERRPPRRRGVRRAGSGSALTFLEDISAIIGESGDLRSALERLVEVVAQRMDTEVCSLYLCDPRNRRLTLWATTGLDRASVGHVSMGLDEGLVGYVVKCMQPVMAIDALAHPRYKYFPETGEERYHSFLAVPVLERRQPSGVLVVQTSRRRRFRLSEVRLLRTIAGHVSAMISQARLLESLANKEEERQRFQQRMGEALSRLEAYERREEKVRPGRATQARLVGVGASPGFASGRAHLLESAVDFRGLRRRRSGSAREEIGRFRGAVAQSVRELAEFRERVGAKLPEFDAAIFDAHRLMLEDEALLGKVEARIRQGASAEAALEAVVNEYARGFREMSDAYLRERAADVEDIGQRVLRNLLGVPAREGGLHGPVVAVAGGLALSNLALVEEADLRGIVLATGGVTSHTSILARSLEIPAVIGVEHLEGMVREGDQLIVDGNAGVVYVNPTAEIAREYERLEREYRAFGRELEALRDLPAQTRDGKRVCLQANVVLLSDLGFARQHGADGVGLYRTEFAFLSHRDFLTEEEQVELYRRMAAGMPGKPVTIRTLDLGADKYPAYVRTPREENPFLGWRSIRISLEMADIFKAQLRAILRVGAEGPVRILFPMISSVDELRQVKVLLEEARAELRKAGRSYDPEMPTGIMVEVPSAVSLARELIREVDFFSIGTNDLIQYLLAVDRNNRKVSPLYEPLHPAVLRAIAETVQAAQEAGKGVSLCGEMAADPVAAMLLVGIGIADLSMSPFFIPAAKRVIRGMDFAAAQCLAAEVLALSTVKEVKRRVFDAVRELGVTDVVEMYH